MIIAAIVLKHSLKGFHTLPLPWNILLHNTCEFVHRGYQVPVVVLHIVHMSCREASKQHHIIIINNKLSIRFV